ncbi:transposase [Streptomyces virginiae]|uniref:transposase n=1 Tax=Streptomyces virginiae TaxID=1961 RepID=UPI00361E2378
MRPVSSAATIEYPAGHPSGACPGRGRRCDRTSGPRTCRRPAAATGRPPESPRPGPTPDTGPRPSSMAPASASTLRSRDAPGQKGFEVIPRRWVVERTFGWLMNHRRLTRDYETHPHRSEAMIRVAMIDLMSRRLTQQSTPNWNGSWPNHETCPTSPPGDRRRCSSALHERASPR